MSAILVAGMFTFCLSELGQVYKPHSHDSAMTRGKRGCCDKIVVTESVNICALD